MGRRADGRQMRRVRETADPGPDSPAPGRRIVRRCVSRSSLLLKVWAAQREADRERPFLSWIRHISQLLEDDALGVRGHRARKEFLIDHVYELGVVVDVRNARALLGE